LILQQIYPGKGIPNFIRIAQVLWKILQKHVGIFFSGHTVHLKQSKNRRLDTISARFHGARSEETV